MKNTLVAAAVLGSLALAGAAHANIIDLFDQPVGGQLLEATAGATPGRVLLPVLGLSGLPSEAGAATGASVAGGAVVEAATAGSGALYALDAEALAG